MQFQDFSLQDFCDQLATKSPVPGGGGATALVGALGIALGTMVGSLTVGKKTYQDVEPEILALMEEAEALRRELMSLIDRDAQVFLPLTQAYAIPKDDPTRDEVMEKCLLDAALVPLEMMKLTGRAILLHQTFAEKGSKIAISDAGTGVVFCWSALYGAALNVFINTKAMANRAVAQDLNQQAEALMDSHWKIAEAVYQGVKERLMS